MHSGATEKAGSPRKRVLSRGMSEEESLRHIIKEAEESNKRLSRSDSRYGSLKRGETRESLSEEDQTVSTDMMELQANYDDCVQELQALELRQDVLLFQVDCLQDALEGAEEMLAETQREAHDATMELERERVQRKKLEDMVAALMQEVERLKEEQNSVPADLVKSTAQEENGAAGTKEDPDDEVDGPQTSSASGSSALISQQQKMMGLLSLFKNIKLDPNTSKQAAPSRVKGSPEGTSVDQEPGGQSDMDQGSAPKEGGGQKTQDGEDNDESSGYEDAPSEFSPSSTPDGPLEGGFLEEDDELNPINDPKNPRSPSDSCVLS